MSRRRVRRVPTPGAAALFVVAGLPQALRGRAEPILNELVSGETRVVALASAESDGVLYPEKLVSAIVLALTGFVIRRRTRGPESSPSPSSIRLLYVPAPDDWRLLRRLDFAVLPVPLRELAVPDAKGRQLRHSSDALKDAVVRVVDSAGPAGRDLSLVKERINRLADSEPFLLPPRNFYLDREVRVDTLFQAFVQGDRPWTDRAAELRTHPFTRDNLPRLPRDQTRRAFQDERGLIFLTAHRSAFHGVTREAEEAASEGERLFRLKGLYRFGMALPQGFHHDVQLEHEKSLAEVEFECGTMGRVRGRDTHANIYANDFVRMNAKTEI